jgi:hypothetical protein
MIYKLLDSQDQEKCIEIQITSSQDIELTIYEHLQHSTEVNSVIIDKNNLYTLIGALHSIQKQLN